MSLLGRTEAEKLNRNLLEEYYDAARDATTIGRDIHRLIRNATFDSSVRTRERMLPLKFLPEYSLELTADNDDLKGLLNPELLISSLAQACRFDLGTTAYVRVNSFTYDNPSLGFARHFGVMVQSPEAGRRSDVYGFYLDTREGKNLLLRRGLVGWANQSKTHNGPNMAFGQTLSRGLSPDRVTLMAELENWTVGILEKRVNGSP